MTQSAEFLVPPKVVTAVGVGWVRFASVGLPLIVFVLVRSLFAVLNVLVLDVADDDDDEDDKA